MARVLVACEFSGTVRDAFAAAGHDAWSCDILPTDKPGNHYQCDVREVLYEEWDLMIAHPPCTHLAVSGARWWKNKGKEQEDACKFVLELAQAPIPRIAIENPIGFLSTAWRKPDQIIQPWQFGHGETKATCLWLKGLPKLEPTEVVEGRKARIHRMPPSEDRWKLRSLTYTGIAKAMADQWGGLLPLEAWELSELEKRSQHRDGFCHLCGSSSQCGCEEGMMRRTDTIAMEIAKRAMDGHYPLASNLAQDIEQAMADFGSNVREECARLAESYRENVEIGVEPLAFNGGKRSAATDIASIIRMKEN